MSTPPHVPQNIGNMVGSLESLLCTTERAVLYETIAGLIPRLLTSCLFILFIEKRDSVHCACLVLVVY